MMMFAYKFDKFCQYISSLRKYLRRKFSIIKIHEGMNCNVWQQHTSWNAFQVHNSIGICSQYFIIDICNILGALYLDKCPIQRYIPIYLIVSGAVGIVYNVFGILKKMAKRSEDEDTEERPGTFTSVCSCVFGCFLFAWFIAGEFLNNNIDIWHCYFDSSIHEVIMIIIMFHQIVFDSSSILRILKKGMKSVRSW